MFLCCTACDLCCTVCMCASVLGCFAHWLPTNKKGKGRLGRRGQGGVRRGNCGCQQHRLVASIHWEVH